MCTFTNKQLTNNCYCSAAGSKQELAICKQQQHLSLPTVVTENDILWPTGIAGQVKPKCYVSETFFFFWLIFEESLSCHTHQHDLFTGPGIRIYQNIRLTVNVSNGISHGLLNRYHTECKLQWIQRLSHDTTDLLQVRVFYLWLRRNLYNSGWSAYTCCLIKAKCVTSFWPQTQHFASVNMQSLVPSIMSVLTSTEILTAVKRKVERKLPGTQSGSQHFCLTLVHFLVDSRWFVQ